MRFSVGFFVYFSEIPSLRPCKIVIKSVKFSKKITCLTLANGLKLAKYLQRIRDHLQKK